MANDENLAKKRIELLDEYLAALNADNFEYESAKNLNEKLRMNLMFSSDIDTIADDIPENLKNEVISKEKEIDEKLYDKRLPTDQYLRLRLNPAIYQLDLRKKVPV